MIVWHLLMLVAAVAAPVLVAFVATSAANGGASRHRKWRLFAKKDMKWNADKYQRDANFVSTLGEPLLELLQAQSHERILDLGCGDGSLTAQIASEHVVGVDSSPEQVRAARSRGLDARVVDGFDLVQAFSAATFDAVLSNAALHWMKRPHPAAVVQGVHHILQPGGSRFVAEFGGYGNIQTVREALQTAFARRGWNFTQVDPWYFPTAEEYRGLLEEAGFTVRSMELFPRPTLVPNGIQAWLELFVEPLLPAREFQNAVNGDGSSLKLLVQEVEDLVRPQLWKPHENGDGGGDWYVDYVRLRFYAVKD